MYVVGLTGGIGSGKSAVSRQLENMGVKIIDADIVAREVVEPGEPALGKIAEYFGEDTLNSDGSLNRAALREIVFADEKKRTWLEQLLHPIIRNRILQQLEHDDSSYSILVSPLLLETDQHLLVNHVVVVDVEEQQQIDRTITRDNTSQDQVKAILAAQISREQRLEKADSVIDNCGSFIELESQVVLLHQKLLELAARDSN